MRTPREKSNILVRPLEMSKANKEAAAAIAENSALTVTGAKPFSGYGIVDNSNGLYLLNREGVGEKVEDKVEIEFYGEFKNDKGERSISMFPNLTKTFSPDELRAMATLPSEPLETFIRTFGARLDNNYRDWATELKEKRNET